MSELKYRVIEDDSRTAGAVLQRDGVHFGYYASGEERPVLLLYKKGTEEIAAEIPFPESALGDGYFSMKVKFPYSGYEYNFREGENVVTDPYARRICGREQFGVLPSESPHALRGGFPQRYHWGSDRLPGLPFEDAVMYHLHVRGFTMQKNSGVRKKGTFAGIREKIPYLKRLGINQVKLMPVYEFAELAPRLPKRSLPAKTQVEAAARALEDEKRPEQYKMNFWGYGDGYYFAPKSAYAAGKSPDTEMKDMVKALHAEGIEVILEFAFSDDVHIGMIEECLSCWAMDYHIDGFSVIARESVVEELARLPLFRRRKLICNWYPDGLKSWNAEKNHGMLAESNDGFMNDCRRLLKGDESCLGAFSFQIRNHPEGCARINYMTNHDGFTMMDLVSYDRKYNLDNGEQDRDGTDYNLSWNCGAEGPSRKKDIAALRMRQRKNAYAMMLFAQGTPMLLAGDEFGNSQNGNNNPYCHDSELSWLDWSGCRRNRELTEFVEKAVAYRKAHRVLHQPRALKLSDQLSSGFPDLSFHGEQAWYGDMERGRRHLGCMYSGRYTGEEGFVYIAYNFHWNPQEFALPLLPKGEVWQRVMDTSRKESFLEEEAREQMKDAKSFTVPARTIVILEGK
ncbi:MAG: alpha-amylase family glycosyl hydrolase [Lachnospiraceae bacterium]|nr:alpha-amylase family glycosyl hydrolase [Lachnospiraceae bacterium]